MRILMHLSFCLFTIPPLAHGQCVPLELPDLQTLQRNEPEQKENGILSLGFDRRSDFVLKGATVRSFSKCWAFNQNQQPVFEQVIWWNASTDAITFFTLREQDFVHLRKSIVERHASGPITENPDFYVGKMFQYRFGQQDIAGISYFFVAISHR